MARAVPFLLALLLGLDLGAGTLAPETQAKFLKILLSSTGQFGFACADPGFKSRLEAAGIAVSPGFKMAWGASETEARTLKAAGKLVVVPDQAWLRAGGAIALVEEGGKPQIHFNMANVKASGMTLSDALIQMGKRP